MIEKLKKFLSGIWHKRPCSAMYVPWKPPVTVHRCMRKDGHFGQHDDGKGLRWEA